MNFTGNGRLSGARRPNVQAKKGVVMAVIQLKGLTPDSAETVIARIWYALEQHDIESPRIATCQASENA